MLKKEELPETCYVAQDGGYFYFMAKPDHETSWNDIGQDNNPTIHFVQSPYDPEFGDHVMAKQARDWLIKEYSATKLVFD